MKALTAERLEYRQLESNRQGKECATVSATAISKVGFDYESVGKEVAAKLQNHACHLRKAIERFGEAGQKIGEIIWNAHEELSGKGRDGKFKEWVELETGLSRQHAYDLMNVWERSKKYPIIGHFPPTVAYLVSAPEVPEAAIKDFERQVSKGLKPTVAAVKATIDKHKEPAEPRRTKPPTQSAAPAADTQDDAEFNDHVRQSDQPAAAPSPETQPAKPPTFSERVAAHNLLVERLARAVSESIKDWPDSHELEKKQTVIKQQIQGVCGTIRTCKVHDKPCPKCEDNGKACKVCGGFGMVTEMTYDGMGGK